MRHARPDYDRFQDPAGKIPADEPVFLLRGQDSLAWAAVRHYAMSAAAAGLTHIAVAAGNHAGAMHAWARKLPDMPADADFREVGEEPTPDQRPGPAEAIANIEAFLMRVGEEPGSPKSPDHIIATPANPLAGETITIGDLKAVLAAFRPYPRVVIEASRKRMAEIESDWEEKGETARGAVGFLIRLARAYLDSPMNADPASALQERAEICKALGCVDATRRYLLAAGAVEDGIVVATEEAAKPPFRTGDCVVNKHNGEGLTVAWADPETGYFHWFGHPPGRARSSDFRLSLAANEEVHKLALLQLKQSGGPVAEKALAYYGAPEASNG